MGSALNLALIAFLPTGFSSFAKMRSELQNVAQRSTSRSISGQIGAAMQFIDEYGCWCFFDENYTLGKAKPMDQMDSYCRDLHNGYDCIIMDVNETCVPYDVDYSCSDEKNQEPFFTKKIIIVGIFDRFLFDFA